MHILSILKFLLAREQLLIGIRLAVFFFPAHIGVDRFPLCRDPLRELWVHPAAAAAPEQAGEQSFVAAGLAVGLGTVALQRLLNLSLIHI